MKLPDLAALATATSSPLRMLSGQALLEDMEAFRKEVTATPEAAREALRRIGVLDKDGRLQRLIHE